MFGLWEFLNTSRSRSRRNFPTFPKSNYKWSRGEINVKRHSENIRDITSSTTQEQTSYQACHIECLLKGEHLPPITRQVSNTSSPWNETKVIVGTYSLQLLLIVQLPLPWDLKWFHLIADPIDLRRQDIQVILRERKRVSRRWNQFMFGRLARHDLICKQTFEDINHAMSKY